MHTDYQVVHVSLTTHQEGIISVLVMNIDRILRPEVEALLIAAYSVQIDTS